MQRQTTLFLLICSLVIFWGCNKTLTGSNERFSDGLAAPTDMGIGRTDSIIENPFVRTSDSSVTTFSIDADGGSYALVRKLLNSGMSLNEYRQVLRIEEFLNYFPFNYPDAEDGSNIAVNGEVSSCPWNMLHKLIRIGVKGKSLEKDLYPAANYVLLADVSGSMQSDDKLDLIKKGFITFAKQMRANDRLAIITYAGNESVVLPSTPGNQQNKIIAALEALSSGGSTNGAGGIRKAYEIAQENFIEGGNNRVILGTDGDFNVGITSTDELVKLVTTQKEKGIFLTTIGVGLGNYNEAMMEKLANKGDGHYEYLDNEEELKKIFIDEYHKFMTVGKDVKVQVHFNPDIVEEYRLIGYENRSLTNNDFTNDERDAGEIGAGQTITALYEIQIKANVNFKMAPSFKIDFRYKKPGSPTSIPLALDIFDEGKSFEQASENLRFAASLAGLGLYIRQSAYKGSVTLDQVKSWANRAKTFDPYGYRARHLDLLNKLQ